MFFFFLQFIEIYPSRLTNIIFILKTNLFLLRMWTLKLKLLKLECNQSVIEGLLCYDNRRIGKRHEFGAKWNGRGENAANA